MKLKDSPDRALLNYLKTLGNQKIGIVYRIICLQNDRSYVGQTSVFSWWQLLPNVRRFQEHRNALLRGAHSSKLMQADWDKFGEESFEVRILEIIVLESSSSKKMLLEQERFWQLRWNAIYSQKGNQSRNKRMQYDPPQPQPAHLKVVK